MLPTEMAEVGDFRLEEVEVNAEVTGEGSLMLLGTGVRAAGMGGIKFVLRRVHDETGYVTTKARRHEEGEAIAIVRRVFGPDNVLGLVSWRLSRPLLSRRCKRRSP